MTSTPITATQVVEYLRTWLAADLPHLLCTVELRDEAIYVNAVPV